MTATPFTDLIKIQDAEGDLYTAPAGGAFIQNIAITNTHSDVVNFYLAVKVGATTLKWGGAVSLDADPGGDSDTGAKIDTGPITLEGGAKIRGEASVDDVLDVIISGVEIS